MEVQRTPEVAFDDLPGYPYAPRYLELGGAGGLRVHHLDEGVREHPCVLLLHGLPGWSYGFRDLVPILVEAGCRAVAPDLIGCGKSDKPAAAAHGYAAHVEWLGAFVSALGLRDVTLVCEDVGAILGLRLVVDMPDRFSRVVAIEPALPGVGPVPPALARWSELAGREEWPPPSSLVRERCARPLSEPAARAFDAPFQGATSVALRALAGLSEDAAAIEGSKLVLSRLPHFLGPFVVAVAERDDATREAADAIAAVAPGARWLEGPAVEAGRHMVAEDRGAELAHEILSLIRG